MHLLSRMSVMIDFIFKNVASPAARNKEQVNITKKLSTVEFEPTTPHPLLSSVSL